MTKLIRKLISAVGLATALVVATPVVAQNSVSTKTLSSATCPGTGCLVVGTNKNAGIGIQIKGTFSGTITFKATVKQFLTSAPDCSTDDFTSIGAIPIATPAGTPVTTATNVGNWSAAVGGQSYVCVVFTSYSSGSAVVTTNTAATTGRMGGGGGGGMGMGDALTTDPLSQFAATTSAEFAGVISDETGTGKVVLDTAPTITNAVLTAPNIGTPSAGVATNITGLPLATGITGLGANVAGVLAVFSSANLRLATTDESGTGALLFAGGNIGAATGTSLSLSGLGGNGTRCVQVDNNGLFAVAAAGCGSTGATAALDNLSAVNINSAFLFQSAVDIGSTTKPAKDIYIYGTGTYGSTYIRLTGAPTGNRVVTLPNLTSTLIYLGGPGGTPSSIDLTNATSATLPIAAIGGLSTGVATALASMTVANLATALGSQSANTVMASTDGSAGVFAARTLTYGYLPQAVPITQLSVGATLASYNGTYELNFASPDTIVLPATASHPGAGASFSAVNGSSNFTLDGNSSETICDNSGCATTKTYSANQSVTLEVNAAGTGWRVVAGEKSGGSSSTVYPTKPDLRLTTQSGVCQSTADRTAQGIIYYTPGGYCGGGANLSLYSGTAWMNFTQAELSLALTVTSGKNYDVFVSYNSGTPILVLSAAWTNDTTRADALALQDGLPVKSSDHTLLAVGVIRASGSNVTEDSGGGSTTQVGGKRFVWNMFNRVPRSLAVIDTTDSWTYSTNTWRAMNGNAGNRVEYVTGDAGTTVQASSLAGMAVNTTTARASMVGIGIDSTSTPSGTRAGVAMGSVGSLSFGAPQYAGVPGLGYHFIAPLEKGGDGVTSDFVGDDAASGVQSGLTVTIAN